MRSSVVNRRFELYFMQKDAVLQQFQLYPEQYNALLQRSYKQCNTEQIHFFSATHFDVQVQAD